MLLPTPLGIKGAELTSQVLAVPGRVKHDTASVHLALAHLALSAPAKKKKKKKKESIQNERERGSSERGRRATNHKNHRNRSRFKLMFDTHRHRASKS